MSAKYYECAAKQVQPTPDPSDWYFEPAIADACLDSSGNRIGNQVQCEQDSDTNPTSFIVKVSDRADSNTAPNPTVHQEAQKIGTLLGNTFTAAQFAVTQRYGAVRANNMLDQVVSGE
jgi:hypothetical protein